MEDAEPSVPFLFVYEVDVSINSFAYNTLLEHTASKIVRVSSL